MPLPSLEKLTPIFDIIIPSTQDHLQFRPFLVKEEKLLLIALEGEEEKLMLDALCQVIGQCAMSPLKVDSLSVFDIEYIFLKLRAKSVGENADISYRCQNKIETTKEEADKRRRGGSINRNARQNLRINTEQDNSSETGTIMAACENLVKVSIPLDKVEIVYDPRHSKKIWLSDVLGITMKYPNILMAKRIANSKTSGTTESVTDALDGVAMCVESVFDEETVYSNFTTKEVGEWLEKLTQAQFSKIQQFFDTTPKLAYDIPFHCQKCGYSEDIHLEGLAAFFE
jgi:hypothetical protein